MNDCVVQKMSSIVWKLRGRVELCGSMDAFLRGVASF